MPVGNGDGLCGRQSLFFITMAAKPLAKQGFVTEIWKVPLSMGLPNHDHAGHTAG